jgi:hypothetical protein
LIRARTTANTRAEKKPSTVNHGMIFATNSTISILITRDIRPSVSILIGNVITFKKNPILLFTRARTTATIIAVIYPSICDPGVRYEAIAIAIPDTKIFRRIAIYIV